MANDDDYLASLAADRSLTTAFHTKGLVKTEQQKALEELIAKLGSSPKRIADIACGGGTLTYHLSSVFPAAHFTLCDRDAEALDLARKLNGNDRATYLHDDINTLGSIADGAFDLVCCWQTLSWLNDPEAAVDQLIRITAPGGRVFASSLFNLQHDVDIRARVQDHTRQGAAAMHWHQYNTFSERTVNAWLNGKVSAHVLHPFSPGVDIVHTTKGLGTFTVSTPNGRLQISGGLLMNWAILEIVK